MTKMGDNNNDLSMRNKTSNGYTICLHNDYK